MTEKKTLSLKRTRPTGETTLNTKRKRRIVVNADAVQAKPKKPAKNVNKNPQRPKIKKTPPSEVKAQELDCLLSDRFEVWRTYQPLQIGVHKELYRLISAEHLPYSKRVVQKVMRGHVRSSGYLNNIQQGNSRVPLWCNEEMK
jgi:hypothetical protein